MRRILKLLILFSVLALGTSAHAQQTDLRSEDLIGSYSHVAGYAGSSITLEPEGHYHALTSDCTQEYFDAGTYAFKAGKITLTTTKSTVKSHGESEDQARNLLDPKVYKDLFHSEPPPESRTSELIPVKWGERLYLISKDSFVEFCNAINLGLEPRSDRRSEWYLGLFFLRDGDEEKTPVGRPSLAADILDLLLQVPIEAKIINIEFEGKQRIAVIDKGSNAGLKRGMRLMLSEKEDFFRGPSLWSGLVVVSVSLDMARLSMLDEGDIGDKVTSKFVDRRFQ
jgi:hypothetical protein